LQYGSDSTHLDADEDQAWRYESLHIYRQVSALDLFQVTTNCKIVLDEAKLTAGIMVKERTFLLELLMHRGKSNQTMPDTFILACDLKNNDVPEFTIIKARQLRASPPVEIIKSSTLIYG